MKHCKNSENGSNLNACTCGGQEPPKHHYCEQRDRKSWPLPKDELDKFRYVVGNYVFVLECLLKDTVVLTLQYTFGVRSECCTVALTEQDYDWRISCRFKYASAVAAVIPRAEAFLRSLTGDSERVKLPDGAHWDRVSGVVGAYVSRNGMFYPLPESEFEAGIFDTLAKEFRRTHHEETGR